MLIFAVVLALLLGVVFHDFACKHGFSNRNTCVPHCGSAASNTNVNVSPHSHLFWGRTKKGNKKNLRKKCNHPKTKKIDVCVFWRGSVNSQEVKTINLVYRTFLSSINWQWIKSGRTTKKKQNGCQSLCQNVTPPFSNVWPIKYLKVQLSCNDAETLVWVLKQTS